MHVAEHSITLITRVAKACEFLQVSAMTMIKSEIKIVPVRSNHSNLLLFCAGLRRQLAAWQVRMLSSVCTHILVRAGRQNVLHCSIVSHEGRQAVELCRLSGSSVLHDFHLCWHWHGFFKSPRSVPQHSTHWAICRHSLVDILWSKNPQGRRLLVLHVVATSCAEPLAQLCHGKCAANAAANNVHAVHFGNFCFMNDRV